MTTPLLPVFQKRINDSFEQLRKNQVHPWAMLNSGKPMRVKKHDLSQISYEGIGFEGSPENVFWSRYVEPFMEEIAINEIDAAVNLATKRNVDARILLPEVKDLLIAGVSKTFSEMAKIDQRLKGRGFPEKIPLRSISKERDQMNRFIDVRIKSELDMWKPKSKLEVMHEKNKSIVWIIGSIIAIVAAGGGLAGWQAFFNNHHPKAELSTAPGESLAKTPHSLTQEVDKKEKTLSLRNSMTGKRQELDKLTEEAQLNSEIKARCDQNIKTGRNTINSLRESIKNLDRNRQDYAQMVAKLKGQITNTQKSMFIPECGRSLDNDIKANKEETVRLEREIDEIKFRIDVLMM